MNTMLNTETTPAAYFTEETLPVSLGHNTNPNPASFNMFKEIPQFDSISLKDIQNIGLMNRIDTKFVFHGKLLPMLLQQLTNHYYVLEIEDSRIFTYENVYWDTPDFRFYHNHHNGKLNRYKVRHRRYKETGTAFLEVKFKSNKKRTIKERISVHGLHKKMPLPENMFLKQRLPAEFHHLQPSLFGVYKRITFASKTSEERVTIDFDARFQNPGTGEKVHLKNVVIAEVKRPKAVAYSRFLDIMHNHRLHTSSISKYCIGCSMTAPERLKTNRFKMKLRGLHLIERKDCNKWN
ncbi:MAG: VTC domain-containing protein [Calditrichaeota bacterium]|nr:MAG: VTC domain-containing protein [Calditrichota bacterium]